MSLAFFVLSSLDLLNATDKISPRDRQAWIDWIYAQQSPNGGFSGAPAVRLPSSVRTILEIQEDQVRQLNTTAAPSFHCSQNTYDTPHLAMTYTALCNLAILNDDFSRLNKEGLQRFVQSCQTGDGA